MGAAIGPDMIKPSGIGCITLAELDSFVAGDLAPQVGAGVVVQQPSEPLESLLGRVQRSARVLRESGYQVARASFLLGPHRSDRLTERLELARSLLDLSTDSSTTLHLVSTAEPGEQERLFELVGWLLAEARDSQRIHLRFRERAPVACVPCSPHQLSTDADRPVFDLTA